MSELVRGDIYPYLDCKYTNVDADQRWYRAMAIRFYKIGSDRSANPWTLYGEEDVPKILS
jgi:hypothetical protein